VTTVGLQPSVGSSVAHTPAFCRNRIRLRSWRFSHVPALPLPAASTDHVYVASLVLNAAQVRRARRPNLNAVRLKLISRPPARRPTCRVQVRHASLPYRQLGGACADRLRVNTPIYLHCIQRRRRTLLRFCQCVFKRPRMSPSGLRPPWPRYSHTVCARWEATVMKCLLLTTEWSS
jgi:hypothetical protein